MPRQGHRPPPARRVQRPIATGRRCARPGCKTLVLRDGYCVVCSPTAVTVVCGPPCSGKTTYVRERADLGDLVIDFDALATALYGQHDRTLTPDQVAYVAEARDALLARLAQRRTGPEPARAWVITSAPRITERRRYVQVYGARIVVLDTPAEECRRRLHADPAGRDIAHTEAVIDAWHAEQLRDAQ